MLDTLTKLDEQDKDKENGSGTAVYSSHQNQNQVSGPVQGSAQGSDRNKHVPSQYARVRTVRFVYASVSL